MLPQEIIRHKRDGLALSEAEIAAFVKGIADGAIGEGQMAAFAMAVLLKGMNAAERAMLTRAMARSGTVLDWSGASLNGPVLDKHSTGGVGDKVSLILAPIAAACGGFVPMLSGRGLGHTGGTLDKLSAIPGYATQPDIPTLRRVVAEVGCAVVGATADLAPADRSLYAVRDVTATVESIDLITASILAKKLAAGLDALVMDVKFGSGAFLPARADAEALARSLVEVGQQNGLEITALLTDMNSVLGRSAGNALEVAEAVSVLKNGGGDPRLTEVTIALSAELLTLGGLAADVATGRDMAQKALSSGHAAERFGRMVAALGGPDDLLDAPERHLPAAPFILPVEARDAGRVASIDVRKVGLAIVSLGGGRVRTEDPIDVAVGLSEVAGLGEAVEPGGRPLALIHAHDQDSA
ncbi:MAG TPA: thymidine phosphorylase, partial [Alphaproteobacteria bacterium]|nr:thymidine phosphorylase [Alphaproteobacteria bacterium]